MSVAVGLRPLGLGEPVGAGYPPYVTTLEQKRRWDTCEELAEAMFGDLDHASAGARCRARSVFYRSDSPTGDESERDVVWRPPFFSARHQASDFMSAGTAGKSGSSSSRSNSSNHRSRRLLIARAREKGHDPCTQAVTACALTRDGHEVLARHVANAIQRAGRRGWRFDKPGPAVKIDAQHRERVGGFLGWL